MGNSNSLSFYDKEIVKNVVQRDFLANRVEIQKFYAALKTAGFEQKRPAPLFIPPKSDGATRGVSHRTILYTTFYNNKGEPHVALSKIPKESYVKIKRSLDVTKRKMSFVSSVFNRNSIEMAKYINDYFDVKKSSDVRDFIDKFSGAAAYEILLPKTLAEQALVYSGNKCVSCMSVRKNGASARDQIYTFDDGHPCEWYHFMPQSLCIAVLKEGVPYARVACFHNTATNTIDYTPTYATNNVASTKIKNFLTEYFKKFDIKITNVKYNQTNLTETFEVPAYKIQTNLKEYTVCPLPYHDALTNRYKVVFENDIFTFYQDTKAPKGARSIRSPYDYHGWMTSGFKMLTFDRNGKEKIEKIIRPDTPRAKRTWECSK